MSMSGAETFEGLIGRNGPLDVDRFISALWEQKDVKERKVLIDNLCIFIDDKDVFRQIEFYFPQILHMALQLPWDPESYRSVVTLVATICAISVHAALQIHLIVFAASQDYQPELPSGVSNPDFNETLYLRCVTMLQVVESACVFGRGPSPSQQHSSQSRSNSVSSIINNNNINSGSNAGGGGGGRGGIVRSPSDEPPTPPTTAFTDYRESHTENKDRIFKIINQTSLPSANEIYEGMLFYKRHEKKDNAFYDWKFKPRYFVVQNRTLLCYREKNKSLILRAIPLYYSTVTEPEEGDSSSINGSKDANSLCFDVHCEVTGAVFHLKANDKASKEAWLKIIRCETGQLEDQFPKELNILSDSFNASAPWFSNESGMSPSTKSSIGDSLSHIEQVKFLFFEQQKKFIHSLTDIAERLRPRSPSLRKNYLKYFLYRLAIPPLAYVPFSSSCDPYACVLATFPEEGHAFNTKARCPSLIRFEIERHPASTDIASFFNCDLQFYASQNIRSVRKIGVHDVPDKLDDLTVHGDVAASTSSSISSSSSLSSFNCYNSNYKSSIWQRSPVVLARYNDTKQLAPRGMLTPSRLETPLTSRLSSASSLVTPGDIDLQVHRDDDDIPHSEALGESIQDKESRLLKDSKFSRLSTLALDGLISKSNDDVRQEVFVIQLIFSIQKIFTKLNCAARLYTYKILNTSKSTGLIELIPNSISLDGLKKSKDFPGSLREYFYKTYRNSSLGKDEEVTPRNSPALHKAIMCFVRSLAGYSIVAYLLDIKDRHNGNIMIDAEGHLIHIDFGFVFGLAPGKAFSMEKSPWKLTKEYVDLMGGVESTYSAIYRDFCVEAFLAIRSNCASIMTMIQIMEYGSNYPAFKYNSRVYADVNRRFHHDVKKISEVEALMNELIRASYDNAGTNFYDNFQVWTNKIAK